MRMCPAVVARVIPSQGQEPAVRERKLNVNVKSEGTHVVASTLASSRFTGRVVDAGN